MIVVVCMTLVLFSCEFLTGPWFINLNNYDVYVGINTRDSKELRKATKEEGLSNLGKEINLIFIERKSISADPLEFDLKQIKNRNREDMIYVLKEQRLYLVPAEKGDYLEHTDPNKLAIESITSLH